MLSDKVAARLNILTLENNIPAALTIELTRRCPLSCAHCYLPETRGRAAAGKELPAGRWKKILKMFADAGSMFLVFTGGEPLLRPDLDELCAFAKKLNFDVRIYSTGLGLTADRARKLKTAGVSAFEISFYGRAAVHDAVTGLKGSFERSLKAARLLKKSGIGVKLKTPLMIVNSGQARWLLALAKKEGFGISFDPVIYAGSDGDVSNLSLRLGGARLAAAVKVVTAAERSGAGREAPGAPEPDAGASPSLDFLCGAGRNVAAVSPDGGLYPCLQLPVELGDLLEKPFKTLWNGSLWLKKWRKLKVSDLKKCKGCAYRTECGSCPGVSFAESGDFLAPNKPACEIAQITHRLTRAGLR